MTTLIRRLITIISAGLLSYAVFDHIYDEFYSYLPNYDVFYGINNGSRVLSENTYGLREMYNRALEHSILYSAIVFVGILLLSEYIFWSVERNKSK